MCAQDLARNYLLSWFDGEAAQVVAHAALWVPLEAAAVRAGGGGALGSLLDAYCASAAGAARGGGGGGGAMGPPPAPAPPLGGAVHLGALGAGIFPVYRAVRALVEAQLGASSLPVTLSGDTAPAAAADAAREVEATMRRMVAHIGGAVRARVGPAAVSE